MADTTLDDRALIRLSGEGVRDFLQGLVTNDVAGDLPVWAALLTPQGKALFDFIVWPDPGDAGGDLLIDCEASQADALAKRLTLYRLRKPITIARDDSIAVHWAPGGVLGTPDPRLPALGRRWIGPADGAAQGWHAHRRALGVPEGVEELGSDRNLWLECNADLLNGVSFTKGCYVGQENTARMNWRNKVNRRLVMLPDGSVERRQMDGLDAGLIPDWMKAGLAEA
ncbi:YgfZ/GcvT domain-containing protein [Rhizorhabdus dicambivorans]|uniref:Folate-binding protein n=1 Tax=Rhizorhabdus dicambivorans TaxID=1850238 RepID=A0A2A4G124_9SPHN|nr:folate-binding protein YgfZ [Rhizorhabdus dicambivorans]ATE63233.1 folate-binding protein [Rhizorhabdus dicambivorans]PCE43693.1 folate-binding protein [Rhizorhabdus dicambivorans]